MTFFSHQNNYSLKKKEGEGEGEGEKERVRGSGLGCELQRKETNWYLVNEVLAFSTNYEDM